MECGNFGNHIFDFWHTNRVQALALRHQALPRTSFIDHVDGLVRKMAIGNVSICQLRSNTQRLIGIFQIVVLFKVRLQAFEYLIGVLDTRLIHVNLLEASGQRTVLLKDTPELLIRG